jgi:hypothetical protein
MPAALLGLRPACSSLDRAVPIAAAAAAAAAAENAVSVLVVRDRVVLLLMMQGDTTNLLGCLLQGQQLPTTTYTAM